MIGNLLIAIVIVIIVLVIGVGVFMNQQVAIEYCQTALNCSNYSLLVHLV